MLCTIARLLPWQTHGISKCMDVDLFELEAVLTKVLVPIYAAL